MRNRLSETGLMIASANGAVEVVNVLIEAKSDLEAKDAEGKTALLHASVNGCYRVVELLLKSKADANAITNFIKTALHLIGSIGWYPFLVD